MNWKDYPHLFANGKFMVSISKHTSIEKDIWEIHGIHDGELMLERGELKQNQLNSTFECEQLPPEDCTLIARKIEDMTDEEIKKLGEFGSSIWDDPSEDLDFYQVVYLLSIGCYPFNQEDFENGEVLDAKEVV